MWKLYIVCVCVCVCVFSRVTWYHSKHLGRQYSWDSLRRMKMSKWNLDFLWQPIIYLIPLPPHSSFFFFANVSSSCVGRCLQTAIGWHQLSSQISIRNSLQRDIVRTTKRNWGNQLLKLMTSKYLLFSVFAHMLLEQDFSFYCYIKCINPFFPLFYIYIYIYIYI